ncbi:hypothetical protein EEDFHM_02654 [Methylorubrum populi]
MASPTFTATKHIAYRQNHALTLHTREKVMRLSLTQAIRPGLQMLLRSGYHKGFA